MVSYHKVFQVFIWLILFPTLSSFGQLSQRGTPMGLQEGEKEHLSIPDLTVIPAVNQLKLMAEDQVQDTLAGVPYRFGDNIAVNYNPDNAGQWDYFNDGSRLWRMGIHSDGAVSINLTFNKYRLPAGAELFIYTPDGKNIIGAFTHLNNQEDGFFASTLLMGDEVILEYFEPADVEFAGALNLSQVTHGYRGPGKMLTKSFGGSGSCNLNVACPESLGWQDQIRSVAMMISGGNSFCSGALINNTSNDAKPYFLTANHCNGNASTLVFWFNWQSQSCDNPSEIPHHDAMSGSIDRARHEASDFRLLELNQNIPEEYNVYFSGWNRTLTTPLDETVASIHHPSGDIKKFSWSDSGVEAAKYLEAAGTGTTHWMVSSWSGATTTEPGSSGSPIFDAQGRIIGQLHGGYAACGNTESDWYGRLGVSWTGGASDGSRLSNWLDPGNTGANAIMGFDPVMDAADPNAPASPVNIMATAAPDGKLEASVSWTNPLVTFSGEPLSQIDSVNIYRDKILIHSLINPEKGKVELFIDSIIPQEDTYTYTLRATNSFGTSPPVSAMVYVGRDKPGAVNNITLSDLNNYGFLGWEAPQVGSNEGYFLSSSITHYEITRNPDGATFVVEASENSFLDTTITEIGYYSYTIVAANDLGAGLAATSEEVLLAAEGAIFMHSARITTCKANLFDSGGPGGAYQNNENDTLTLLPETEGAKLILKFSAFDTESDYDSLCVYDGDEALGEYLIGSYSGPSVPTDLAYVRSSHASGAITLVFTSDNNVVRQGWSASVACYTPSDNDLAAIALKGNITPSVGSETLYSVTIRNEGFLPQEEYTVSLVSESGENLATVVGNLINPDEIQNLDIPWTPLTGQEGSMKIKAMVTFAGDNNTNNNFTPLLALNVLSQDLIAITVGSGSNVSDLRIPVDFYWKNSLTQTIYYPDEISISNGLITGIAFYNQFENSLADKNIRVYLQHIPQTEMTNGFIAVADDKLVFDGPLNFPSGENNIYMPLDTDFLYNGGNILLSVYRVHEQNYYSENENFFLSATPRYPNRTIQYNSDVAVIDPLNPPNAETITLTDQHANTTFFFDSTYQPKLYAVTFKLDMSEVSTDRYDPAIDTIFITGNMFNWDEPGSQPEKQRMMPSNDTPGLYTLSMQLPAQEYLYKYYINKGWEEGEWTGEPNRTVKINNDTITYDVFAVPELEYTRVQFINNMAGNPSMDVDIYINGQQIISHLPFRHTSDYINIPANHSMKIEVTKSAVDTIETVFSDYYKLSTNSSYAGIIAGNTSETGYQPNKLIQLYMTAVQEVATLENHLDLLVFHGSTDAPSLSLWTSSPNEKISEVGFGQFSGYHQLVTANYVLEVKDMMEDNIIGYFNGNFQDYMYDGKAAILVTSGFLNPTINNNGPEFGLWLATQSHGQMIELQLSTGIDDFVHTNENILVYPNPARERVNIYSPGELQQIRVYDISGKCILNPIAAGNKTSIDTGDLSPGIYIIKIQSSSYWDTKKLIINR